MITKTLYEHLCQYIPVLTNLRGNWLGKGSGYEENLCKHLGFTRKSTRYSDCSFGSIDIELKKGKYQTYFDEVRYAEMLLDGHSLENPTVYFRHKKIDREERITNILIIDSKKIIDLLRLTIDHAKYITGRFKQIGGKGYYSQQAIKYSELCSISDYIIDIGTSGNIGFEPVIAPNTFIEPNTDSIIPYDTVSTQLSTITEKIKIPINASAKIKILILLRERSMTFDDIYKEGIPWSSLKNSLRGRCSELQTSGYVINTNGKYFITEEGLKLTNHS